MIISKYDLFGEFQGLSHDTPFIGYIAHEGSLDKELWLFGYHIVISSRSIGNEHISNNNNSIDHGSSS